MELFRDLSLELLKLFLIFHSLVVPFFSFKFVISNFYQINFSLHLHYSQFSPKNSLSCENLPPKQKWGKGFNPTI
jgi:hypothetical protein